MKTIISLRGISFDSTENRDYRRTLTNTKQLAMFLGGCDFTIYTYDSEVSAQIINDYSPVYYKIIPSYSSQRQTFLNNLHMLKDIDFDFVIISRFDIEFNDFKIFEQLNYNKLNFMFKESNMWDSNQFVSDVLFAFPKIYLQSMIDSVVDVISDIRFINYDFLHNIYKFIEPRIGNNINFVCSGQHFSHDNSFYKLKRRDF